MFVLTVDQVASRRSSDAVEPTAADLSERFGRQLVLGPDRTAGDEFELVVTDAEVALQATLHLLRERRWSVGLGIGAVDRPLPPTAREARGPAFVAARTAVDAAKRSDHRFALLGGRTDAGVGPAGVLALVELVLRLRADRSDAGWQVADLLESEPNQAAVARRLGISPQAVSLRARAAAVRAEAAALPALVALLGGLDPDTPHPGHGDRHDAAAVAPLP